MPNDLNSVGPRALGLVLAATEMDVDEVEVLQQKLDEVRDRGKRKREDSPPPPASNLPPIPIPNQQGTDQPGQKPASTGSGQESKDATGLEAHQKDGSL